MSVEARIEKLESLLGRVQSRRKSLDELGALPEGLEPAGEAPMRAVSPTPMEAALDSVARDAPDDEPELEIVVDTDEDDDEPIITVLPPGGEPEASEPDLLLDETPTAPVHTRAPVQASSPSVPERIAASPAQPSSPVAKVVSQARPRTFGELLDRTLALRPR